MSRVTGKACCRVEPFPTMGGYGVGYHTDTLRGQSRLGMLEDIEWIDLVEGWYP